MYEIHPLCASTPGIAEKDFAVLKADITQRGQTEAILVAHGKVIDGRHRLRACEELGIEPRFEHVEWDERRITTSC